MIRSLRAAVLMAPLVMVMTTAADASTVCERLNAQLSNLPRTIGWNTSLRDYSGAIFRQNLDIRKARSERRSLGCSSGSVIIVNGYNEEACAAIEGSIARMEAELDDLKARREEVATGGETDMVRRRILAALETHGCADEQDQLLSAAAEQPETHRNIIEDLPPIGEDRPILRGSSDIVDFSLDGEAYDGNLRTMCVRTCDGAFFPISSNASPADFQRDAEACQRRCPGTETALYYHVLETEEADQMISAATGEPYADLPTAFIYKTRDVSRPGQCGCAPVKPVVANQSTPSQKSIVQIRTRQPDKKQVQPIIAERPYDPANSKVRVVGPSFLPAQESAIDLRHPTGPGYQQLQTN